MNHHGSRVGQLTFVGAERLAKTMRRLYTAVSLQLNRILLAVCLKNLFPPCPLPVLTGIMFERAVQPVLCSPRWETVQSKNHEAEDASVKLQGKFTLIVSLSSLLCSVAP